MTDQPMRDVVAETTAEAVRTVEDAQGRTWYAYPLLELSKVGAPRRTSWLCLESGSERRFIAPVPAGWRQWTDAALLHAIAVAKPDLRGS